MNSNYGDFRLISNKFYIAFNLQNRDSVDNYVSGTVGLPVLYWKESLWIKSVCTENYLSHIIIKLRAMICICLILNIHQLLPVIYNKSGYFGYHYSTNLFQN